MSNNLSQKINELRHQVAQLYEQRHYDDASKLATDMCDLIRQYQHGEDNPDTLLVSIIWQRCIVK